LKTKLEVAECQLPVARHSKSSRQAEALEQQVESWNSTVAELEENVKEMIMGVFMKQYREKNEYIRAELLKSLLYFSLIRPTKPGTKSICMQSRQTRVSLPAAMRFTS
jgi:hypothetical protein